MRYYHTILRKIIDGTDKKTLENIALAEKERESLHVSNRKDIDYAALRHEASVEVRREVYRGIGEEAMKNKGIVRGKQSEEEWNKMMEYKGENMYERTIEKSIVIEIMTEGFAVQREFGG
jgi:hypothetical protein